jgi:uncharacterized protein (DUF58 family)
VNVADLRALDRLQLLVTRRLDGLLHGDYLGLLPGPGSEAGEAREYRAGDDVRRMDWPVTARTTVPHVRTTIADRELETWLAIDLSPSLDFGTVGMLKRELTEGGPAKAIPPRPGRGGARSLLRTVTSLPRGEGAGNLAELIDKTRRHARRRGLAIVISDFLEDDDHPSEWPRELRRLAVRQQVLCVEVLDPAELALPDVGVLDLMDPETGATVEVQTGNARFRARYAQAAAEQRARIADGIRTGGAAHLRLSTGSDWLRDIAAFIAERRHLAAYR